MPTDQAAISLSSDALAALRQGREIEAIRIVRRDHLTGLKEAKLAVDKVIASDPRLTALVAERRARLRRTVWICFGIAAALAYVAWRLFILV